MVISFEGNSLDSDTTCVRITDQKQSQRKLKIQGVLEKEDGYLEPVTLEADLYEKEMQDSDERFNNLGLIKRLKSPSKGLANELTPDLRDKLHLKSYQIANRSNSIYDIIGQGLQAKLDDVSVDYEIVVIMNTPLPFIAFLYEKWEELSTNDYQEFQDIFYPGCKVRWVIPYFNKLMNSINKFNRYLIEKKQSYDNQGNLLEFCYCDTSEKPEYDGNRNYAIYGIDQVNPYEFGDHANTFFTVLDTTVRL